MAVSGGANPLKPSQFVSCNQMTGTGTSTVLALILAACCSAAVFGQDAISTDVAVENDPGPIIDDHVVASFTGGNPIADVIDLALPPTADITALHFVNENSLLLSLSITTQLGAVVASPGDVIQWDSGEFTVLASGNDLGLGPSTAIDAISMSGEALVFSTKIADSVGGISVSNSDLLTWTSGGGTSLLYSKDTCGIPPTTNLSGIHLLDSGHLLMSFSNAATVGGFNLLKGDVVDCDPITGTVQLFLRFSDIGPNWSAVGIDAVTRRLLDLIFGDGFEG